MSRFHVHLNVADLSASVQFYTRLFSAEPSVLKSDYAKWLLEDPKVNFAISDTGPAPGVDHLGIQVDSDDELEAVGERLHSAAVTVVPEDAAVCCYARSDKLWTEDPQGTKWETFHTLGEATTYYAGDAMCATAGSTCSPDMRSLQPAAGKGASCCAPAAACC